MALVLGVRIGDVVDIANRWIAVLAIENWSSAILIDDGGYKIALKTNDMVEMAPDILISLAPRTPRSQLRLVFDAPRHVVISRRQEPT